MNQVVHVRHKVGLTQHQMAQYLSVSYSLLAMYEKGLRSLPLAALQKMGDLELFLLQPPAQKPVDPAHLQRRETKVKALLQRQALELEYKTAVAQRQLANTQKKYGEQMLLLSFIDHLKTTGNSKPSHTAWQNMMELQANEIVEEHGLHKQELLEMEISGLQMQAELVKKRQMQM